MSRLTSLSSRGEPFVWLTGAGLAAAVVMIVGLLVLVLINGTATFWPKPIIEMTLKDGTHLLGEVTRSESYLDHGQVKTRRLIRTGNYDLYGDDFRWVEDDQVVSESAPPDAWLIERREWGPAIGYPRSLLVQGTPAVEGQVDLASEFERLHREALERSKIISELEKGRIGTINHTIEKERLRIRKAAIEHGEGSEQHRIAALEARRTEEALMEDYREIKTRIDALYALEDRVRLSVHEVDGRLIPERPSNPESPMRLAQVVRAYPANTLSIGQRLNIYADRWIEFLTDEPREANTEGGVFPAIFGTLMMTILMSLAVAPFGVIAALYLREYARQGPLVSTVRIAVNNLAGVPSIVYGVFGLGFFCYLVGGTIDSVFFEEKLPTPTFGTGGILWASLTLAMLTVPVVIVSTEEALAAVPRSMREGSFACGASKWQTVRRIVLPRATPGIMTGLILAMARGAGEVAPLMITGVVKLAPELPFDRFFPYFHFERSFMHLGFHIYDVGFQSRNSEAGKPMVFTTTLILIVMVMLLNFSAVYLRTRLKRRFRAAHF